MWSVHHVALSGSAEVTALGYVDYDPMEATLGKMFYDNYLLLATDSNDISNTVSSHAELAIPPVPHSLIRGSFRRPSTTHTFHQQACFKQPMS